MGELADRLAALSVTVSSPDGNLEAQVIGGQLRAVRFRDGVYKRYTDTDLAHQIARTATLLFVNHDRGVQRIVEDAGLHRPRTPMEAIDEAQRRYLAALPTIYATALGPRELLRLQATGLVQWHCEIAQGTVHYLSEPEFISELTAAGQELLRNHRFETALLRDEHLGSGLGRPALERLRQQRRRGY